MKFLPLCLVAVGFVVGCNRPPSLESARKGEVEIRSVTFASHLRGTIESDPIVTLGERVRVVPHVDEITYSKEPIVVRLPDVAPYTGEDERHFLRGYAIGQLSANNLQFR